jgi:hypothetical protein
MKKTILFLLIVAAAPCMLPACKKVNGEGPVVTENRNTGTYDRVSVDVPAEVFYTQAPGYSLEIHAQQNIINEIETEVVRNELKLRPRHPDTRLRNHEPIKIYIRAPYVGSIEVSSAATFRVDQAFTPTNLRLAVSGSGNIRIHDVVTGKLETWISGSGDIVVEGGAGNQVDAFISGSGFTDISNVETEDVEAKISGSGTVKVFATQTLKATISGSGTVFYRGTPAITTKISGSGNVVKL